jgi:hypothetical protein
MDAGKQGQCDPGFAQSFAMAREQILNSEFHGVILLFDEPVKLLGGQIDLQS